MNRKKLFYCILAGALVFGLIVFSRSSPVLFLRSGAAKILRPVFAAARMLGHSSGAVSGPGGDEITALRAENERLREIEQEYRMLRDEDTGLRKIIGLKEKQRVAMQGAHVVLHSSEFGKEFLMLDEGAQKKIREGDLVVDGRGAVIGVVREADEGSAKVAVASNPGEAFEVVLAPLNSKALAKGIGSRAFSLELVPSETPVRAGDFALISGRLGAESALVAEVTTAVSEGSGAFQTIRGTLIARPETLDEVFVVLE